MKDVLTMEGMIILAKQDDDLREQLQRLNLQEVRMVGALQIRLKEFAISMRETVDIMPIHHGNAYTRTCLQKTAYYMDAAAESLNETIELFRARLDQLGTPE
jgi:hypothetical protein